jgi:hypothetical protein
MTSPSDLTLLVEQHVERWGLATYRSASFLQVPQAYHLAPTLQIVTSKGNTIVLRASDIYGARMKALGSQEIDQDRFALTRLGEHLVLTYRDWLLTAYSSRYRHVSTDAQRAWVTQIIILVIARHLLHYKWTCALLHGTQAFADPWVGSVVSHLALSHGLPGDLARMVHHIVRDPDQQHTLMTQFLEDLDDRMQRHPFVFPSPLPSLPEGTYIPLVSWFERLRVAQPELSLERRNR